MGADGGGRALGERVRVLGIDEAGRGCVLGPLVVAGFVYEGDGEAKLRAAGAQDSKRLSHANRLTARAALAALGQEHVHAIEAAVIDTTNLNVLEEEAIVAMVRATRPDRVLVDALGHPTAIPGIVERLREACGVGAEWVMEPKADGTYAVVGAASIAAKTTRDAALAACAAVHGDLGTGYPSDPVTRAWLESWLQSGKPWPGFVRTRWATISALRQQSLFG